MIKKWFSIMQINGLGMGRKGLAEKDGAAIEYNHSL